MNKSKYITYTTMLLTAFIILEMELFTFMYIKGQDEKEYKFEYGTVMDVRGTLGMKFLIKTESGKRIFVYSNKTLLVGDKVIVKEYKEKYYLSSEKEKSSYNTENKISDTEDKPLFYNITVKYHNGNIKEYRHCQVIKSKKYTKICMFNPYNIDPESYTPLDDSVLWLDNEECEIEMEASEE